MFGVPPVCPWVFPLATGYEPALCLCGMFTGLVETVGILQSRERRGMGYRLAVRSGLGPLELGESVSVNGVCVTVAAQREGRFEFDLSPESVSRTNLARVALGGPVNLERALQLGGRLGGHLVSGHVDAVTFVRSILPMGEATRVELGLPPAVRPYVAPKGSVALDGVSLTVNHVQPTSFDVMLVPFTLTKTTLIDLVPGRELNVEVDLLARYVAHYLSTVSNSVPSPDGDSDAASDSRLIETLKRSGMM